MIRENYTIESNDLGMFFIKFLPANTYCGKSFELTSESGSIEDWWETREEAETALDNHLASTQDPIDLNDPNDPNEPMPLKEYDVHFSVSGIATVLAASKTDALEKLAQETFGNRINRDNATVIAERDLPED